MLHLTIRSALVALLVIGLLPSPASAATWRPTMRTAREYAEQRPGSVSFATIGSGGVFRGHRAATTVQPPAC